MKGVGAIVNVELIFCFTGLDLVSRIAVPATMICQMNRLAQTELPAVGRRQRKHLRERGRPLQAPSIKDGGRKKK